MHTPDRRHFWALVLAGGEGSRLRQLTADASGRVVPKQYCLFAGRTLLAAALDRAHAQVPRGQTLAVVTAAHREYWQRDLVALPPHNVVEQPANRGTAVGILLPLLALHARDPEAVVLLLPSDHHVEREPVLRRALADALEQAAREPAALWLLGVKPAGVIDGLGWITPASHDRRLSPVLGFIEKPSPAAAAEAMRHGALANTFLVAASVSTLLDRFRRTLPDWCAALSPASPAEGESAAYARLPSRDFSRDVLEPAAAEGALRVLRVPPCGWSDLGTPERLAAAATRLRRLGRPGGRPATAVEPRSRPDLAAPHRLNPVV